MIRSFAALTTVQPGYVTEGVLTFRVSLPFPAFRPGQARDAFRDQFFDVVSGMPGVQGVSLINQLPLTGAGALAPFAYNEETALNWESVTADQRYVTPGFFEVMGAELLAGREFNSAEL